MKRLVALIALDLAILAAHAAEFPIPAAYGPYTHPTAKEFAEASNRFYCFKDSSDEMLCALYGIVDGLHMASKGEGFGLPMVEAARYGKPVLARDISVFREIAGDNARYFLGTTPSALAADIEASLNLIREGRAVSSQGISRLTWKESARQMLDNIGLGP